MPTQPRRISDIKPLITNLAQTSHYQVQFGSLPPELSSYLLGKGVDSRLLQKMLVFYATLQFFPQQVLQLQMLVEILRELQKDLLIQDSMIQYLLIFMLIKITRL